MNSKTFTRRFLYDILQEHNGKMAEKFEYLERRMLEITRCPEEDKNFLRGMLSSYKCEFRKLWSNASRKEKKFLSRNDDWLRETLILPYWDEQTAKPKDKQQEAIAGPSGSTKVAIPEEQQLEIKSEKALGLFVEEKLTTEHRRVLESTQPEVFPDYERLLSAQQQCISDREDMSVTDTSLEVRLQALLDHTAKRLCKHAMDIVQTCNQEERDHFVLTSKWGFDGFHHSIGKQKYQHTYDNDTNIAQSSIVPLKLAVVIDGEETKVIWVNPKPSTLKFCRPIRIRFMSEPKDVTAEEVTHVQDQVNILHGTEVETDIGAVTVKHNPIYTMIDIEVCNVINDTAGTKTKCFICSVTPTDYDRLEVANQAPEIDAHEFNFALSGRHIRNRIFEFIVRLAYVIPIRKMQPETEEEVKIVDKTKARLKTELKDKMDIWLDTPRGYSSGNKKGFFADIDTSAAITGVNVRIIRRLSALLEIVASGDEVNVERFETYLRQTVGLYRELYGWYPMSLTMHKLLIHGVTLIRHALLPIGHLAYDADDFRYEYFNEHEYTDDKTWIHECNKSVLEKLLVRSDPVVSSIRLGLFKYKRLTTEAESLIEIAEESDIGYIDDTDNGFMQYD